MSVKIDKGKCRLEGNENSGNTAADNFEKNFKDGLNNAMKTFDYKYNKLTITDQKQNSDKKDKSLLFTKTKMPINDPERLIIDNSRIRSFKNISEKFNHSIKKEKIPTASSNFVIDVIGNNTEDLIIDNKNCSKMLTLKKPKPFENNEHFPFANTLCFSVNQLSQMKTEIDQVKIKNSHHILPSSLLFRQQQKNKKINNTKSKSIDCNQNLKNQSKLNSQKNDNSKQKYLEEMEETTIKVIADNRANFKESTDSDTNFSSESMKSINPGKNLNETKKNDIQEQERLNHCKIKISKSRSCTKLSSYVKPHYHQTLSNTRSLFENEQNKYVRNNKIPTEKTPSANMLIHFRELLNQYDVGKLSNLNGVPLLNEEDANLLRELIKADEKYSYLKNTDRKLLREMLYIQECEIKTKERILKQTLKNLRKAFKHEVPINAATVKEINQIINRTPTEYPKRSFSSGDTCHITKVTKRNKFNTTPTQFYVNSLDRLEEEKTGDFQETDSMSTETMINSTVNSNDTGVKIENKVSTLEQTDTSLTAIEEAEEGLLIPLEEIEVKKTYSVHSIIPYPSLTEILENNGQSVNSVVSPYNLVSVEHNHSSDNRLDEKSEKSVEVTSTSVNSSEKELSDLKAMSLSTKISSKLLDNFDSDSHIYSPSNTSNEIDQWSTTQSDSFETIIYNPMFKNNLIEQSTKELSVSNIEYITQTVKMKWYFIVKEYISYTVESTCISTTTDQLQMYMLRHLSIGALKYVGDVFVPNPDSNIFELKLTNYQELKMSPYKIFTTVEPVDKKFFNLVYSNDNYNYTDEFLYALKNPWKSTCPHNTPIKKHSKIKVLALNACKSFHNLSSNLTYFDEHRLTKLIDSEIMKLKKREKNKVSKTKCIKNLEMDPIKIYRKLLVKVVQIIPFLILIFTFLLPEIRCS